MLHSFIHATFPEVQGFEGKMKTKNKESRNVAEQICCSEASQLQWKLSFSVSHLRHALRGEYAVSDVNKHHRLATQ